MTLTNKNYMGKIIHSIPLVKPKQIRPLRDLHVDGATIF
jgi:hypothetical protein